MILYKEVLGVIFHLFENNSSGTMFVSDITMLTVGLNLMNQDGLPSDAQTDVMARVGLLIVYKLIKFGCPTLVR